MKVYLLLLILVLSVGLVLANSHDVGDQDNLNDEDQDVENGHDHEDENGQDQEDGHDDEDCHWTEEEGEHCHDEDQDNLNDEDHEDERDGDHKKFKHRKPAKHLVKKKHNLDMSHNILLTEGGSKHLNRGDPEGNVLLTDDSMIKVILRHLQPDSTYATYFRGGNCIEAETNNNGNVRTEKMWFDWHWVKKVLFNHDEDHEDENGHDEDHEDDVSDGDHHKHKKHDNKKDHKFTLKDNLAKDFAVFEGECYDPDHDWADPVLEGVKKEIKVQRHIPSAI